MCWDVGEVRGDVGKGEVREMWVSELGPHTITHFHTPPPFLSPHPFPTRPLHPNTLPHSPHALSHTSPHIFPNSFNYVAKLPCDDVTLINLTGKAQ